MLVWKDTMGRAMPTPSWLADAPDGSLARVHTDQGDLLAMGPNAAALLDWRPDAAWYPVGEGWAVAVYGEIEAWRNLRKLPWAIAVAIEDGRGVEWAIPAIISPLGTPCMDMGARLTEAGWEDEPLNPRAARALEACRLVLPFAREDRLHELTANQANSAMAAILEATYHIDALTVGRTGIITGTLRRHGLRCACGVVTADQVR